MVARISKYPPILATALDAHQASTVVTPGNPPPLPPLPMLPAVHWVHMGSVHLMGAVLTGKFTRTTATEYMGDILWGYDWGPLQPHLPVPAEFLVSISLAILPLASQVKFFFPAFSVKEACEGAIPGGKTPVAICLPVYLMQVQTCQDIAGWGFSAPMGICLVVPSVRVVNVTIGDLFAGLIGMATDCVTGLLCSAVGKGLDFPDSLAGGAAGAMVNNTLTGVQLWQGTLSEGGQAGTSMGAACTIPVFGVAVLAGWGGGLAANAVGDAWQPPEGGAGS
jgi:hypothetical protein